MNHVVRHIHDPDLSFPGNVAYVFAKLAHIRKGAHVTFAKKPVLRRSAYAGMLFNGAGRPLKPEGQSSTLPASMGGNKTPIVDQHHVAGGPSFVEEYHRHLMAGGKPYSGDAPRRLRRLTVDECLAIQTFPPEYKLAGKQSAMYRQIGNAVPCKLAEGVARVVARVLDEGNDALELGLAKYEKKWPFALAAE